MNVAVLRDVLELGLDLEEAVLRNLPRRHYLPGGEEDVREGSRDLALQASQLCITVYILILKDIH